jgi:hypothetical protein
VPFIFGHLKLKSFPLQTEKDHFHNVPSMLFFVSFNFDFLSRFWFYLGQNSFLGHFPLLNGLGLLNIILLLIVAAKEATKIKKKKTVSRFL